MAGSPSRAALGITQKTAVHARWARKTHPLLRSGTHAEYTCNLTMERLAVPNAPSPTSPALTTPRRCPVSHGRIDSATDIESMCLSLIFARNHAVDGDQENDARDKHMSATPLKRAQSPAHHAAAVRFLQIALCREMRCAVSPAPLLSAVSLTSRTPSLCIA